MSRPSIGRVMSHHAATVFPQASSIKVAIMLEMFRAAREGRFRFTDTATIHFSDKRDGGYVAILLRKGPVTMTIGELMTHD